MCSEETINQISDGEDIFIPEDIPILFDGAVIEEPTMGLIDPQTLNTLSEENKPSPPLGSSNRQDAPGTDRTPLTHPSHTVTPPYTSYITHSTRIS